MFTYSWLILVQVTNADSLNWDTENVLLPICVTFRVQFALYNRRIETEILSWVHLG